MTLQVKWSRRCSGSAQAIWSANWDMVDHIPAFFATKESIQKGQIPWRIIGVSIDQLEINLQMALQLEEQHIFKRGKSNIQTFVSATGVLALDCQFFYAVYHGLKVWRILLKTHA